MSRGSWVAALARSAVLLVASDFDGTVAPIADDPMSVAPLPEAGPRDVRQTTRAFDRTLNGLIHGDAELRLLPAANADIRAELAKVQLLWGEIQPILAGIAVGAPVDQRTITTVSRNAGRMIAPLNTTSLMYETL